MQDFNGFPDHSTLESARVLLREAASFPKACDSLRGLDAFCQPSGPQISIFPWGALFCSAPKAFFDEGAMGAIGRATLKAAFASPPRAQGTPIDTVPADMLTTLGFMPGHAMIPHIHDVICVPPHSSSSISPLPDPSAHLGRQIDTPLNPPPSNARTVAAPSSRQRSAPERYAFIPNMSLAGPPPSTTLPAQVRDSFSVPAFEDDGEDYEGLDFDPDAFDDQEPTIRDFLAPSPMPSDPPATPPEQALVPAPAPTMTEIRALMSSAASLSQGSDLLTTAFFKLAERAAARPAAFVSRASWSAWGGSAKQAARRAATNLSLRMDSDPAVDQCSSGIMGLFPIDPGPLPAPDAEPVQMDPSFELALIEKLDEALRSALQRSALCGVGATLLCGWGERSAQATSRAILLGFEIIELP